MEKFGGMSTGKEGWDLLAEGLAETKGKGCAQWWGGAGDSGPRNDVLLEYGVELCFESLSEELRQKKRKKKKKKYNHALDLEL